MRENAKRKMLLVLVQCSMAQHVLKNGRVAAMTNCCKIISVLFSVLLPSSSDEMKSRTPSCARCCVGQMKVRTENVFFLLHMLRCLHFISLVKFLTFCARLIFLRRNQYNPTADDRLFAVMRYPV